MCAVVSVRLYGTGSLDWETARESFCSSLQSALAFWFWRICGWEFIPLNSELEGSLAARSADNFAFGSGAIEAHLSGTDARFAVAEDECLSGHKC